MSVAAAPSEHSFLVNYVYYGQMYSPIGRNTLFCCNSFRLSLRNILHVSSDFLKYIDFSSMSDSVLEDAYRLFELLCVRNGFMQLQSSAVFCKGSAEPFLDIDNIRTLIYHLSTS